SRAYTRPIEAAAIELGTDGVEYRVRLVVALACHGEIAKAGAADSRIQLTAHRQYRVAKRLGFQALRRFSPYQAVISIHRRRLAHHPRLLTIGGRRDNQPLNSLQTPGRAIRRIY